MKFRSIAFTILLLGFLGNARAADTARLEVKLSPEGPAKVWVDGKPVLGAVILTPGTHVVRVSRPGLTMERKVLLNAGVHVVLVADFAKRDFRVNNPSQLNYAPLQGATSIIISPANAEPAPAPAPAAPKPPATPAPKPPAAPAPKPTPPAGPPTPPSPPSAEWSPEPIAGEYGPPVPPEYQPPAGTPAESVNLPAAPPAPGEPIPIPGATPLATAPPGEEKIEPTGLVPPCEPKPETISCLKYKPGPEGALYTYYCLLVNHDFEKAYRLRVKVRDLKWFYEAAKPFCAFSGFEIKGLEIKLPTATQAVAAYTVNLTDAAGRLAETWQMKAVLVKEGNYWLISAMTGKKTFPAPKPR